MPTDKPLPDTENDIIDLTDLVEEERAGAKSPGGDAPVDMSFEQELDDLFGDVEPEPGKAASAAADADADEDLIDLVGLELGDTDAAETAPQSPETAADDEAIDLAGLGLDELTDEGPTQTPAFAAGDKDLDDLLGEADAGATETVSADDEAMAGLFDAGEAEKRTPSEAASTGDMNFEGPAEEPAAEEAMDVSEMELSEFMPEAEAAGAEIQVDAAMAQALGELPAPPQEAEPAGDAPAEEMAGQPEPVAAEPEPVEAAVAAGAMTMAVLAASGAASGPMVAGIDLNALDTLIDTAKGPLPEPEAEEPAATAALEALTSRLASLEAATTALAEKCDTLPPLPDEEALAAAVAARLEDSLTERFEALLDSRSGPDLEGLKAELQAEIAAAKPDHEALLADLQNALAPHFESLRQDFPDIGELVQKSELHDALAELREALTRLETQSRERQDQFDDLAGTLETSLAELRRELPEPGSFVSAKQLGAALADVCDTLTNDFAAKLDERLTGATENARQIAREEVQALGETLAKRLDTLETDRIDPETLAEHVREALAGDITARLDERLEGVTESARQTAKEIAGEQVRTLGEALSGRLDTLETDRIDPDALVERVREALGGDISAKYDDRLDNVAQTTSRAEQAANDALDGLEAKPGRQDIEAALAALRTEMRAEMEHAVPRAAAAVIREEIAALAKEFL